MHWWIECGCIAGWVNEMCLWMGSLELRVLMDGYMRTESVDGWVLWN